MECEECQAQAELFDAIYDNKIVRLCKRCLEVNNAIVIKKPVVVEEKRKTVKEVLTSLSGVSFRPIEKSLSTISLEDLRERYAELKEKRKQEVKEEKQEIQKPEERLSESFSEKESQAQAQKGEQTFDFSLEATKRIKVGDLFKAKVEEKENESAT